MTTETLSTHQHMPADERLLIGPDDQPPIGHTLHEQLLLLRGYQSDEWHQPPEQISKEEATSMAEYLLQRVPSLLEARSLPSYVTAHEEKYNNGNGYYVRHISQEWGTNPTSEEVKAVGKIVEFAGPTYGENDPQTAYGISPDIVTNIDSRTGEVDMFTDVRNMPFQDESIGGVFISCLPGAMGRLHRESKGWQTLRADAIDEATRVVKPGGYFYWLGGTPDDVDKILENGFDPVRLTADVWSSKEIPPTAAGKLINLVSERSTYLPVEYSIDGVYQKAAS